MHVEQTNQVDKNSPSLDGLPKFLFNEQTQYESHLLENEFENGDLHVSSLHSGKDRPIQASEISMSCSESEIEGDSNQLEKASQ